MNLQEERDYEAINQGLAEIHSPNAHCDACGGVCKYRQGNMPINPQLPDNRRASSPKRDNDVLNSATPVVTKAVYDAIVRGTGTDANLRTKRLCQVKNLLGQALPIIDSLIRDYGPTVKDSSPVAKSLRQRRVEVERAFLRWPLDIRNK